MATIARKPYKDSYFSLIGLSDAAQKVVTSHKNRHLLSYVDTERTPQENTGGHPSRSCGLNIGHHIPQKEHDLIATIGRTGDIIIEKDYIPRLQCSFRINKDTGAILFYDHADTRLFENNLTDPRYVNDFQKTKHGLRVLIISPHRTVFGFGAQGGEEFKFEVVWHNKPQKPLSDEERQRVRHQATLSIPLQRNDHCSVKVLEKGWGPKLKLLLLEELVEDEDKEVVVSKAIDIANGKVLAVKTMGLRQNPGKVRHTISREVEALSKFEHRNVIQILSAHWNNESFQIITACYEGDAANLKSDKQQFRSVNNFYPVQGLFRNVLSALDYVHSKGIMHRDVKPENILYTSKFGDGNAMTYEFKLADFGASNQIRRGNTFCGTHGYIAPEISSKNVQSSKVDIWSLFATLLYFLDIELGPGVINNAIEDRNVKGIRKRNEYKILHFIADMYDVRPDKRPTAAELKQRLRSPMHKHELLASLSIPGFPASSRAFSDSSMDLPGTPGGTIHPAYRLAPPPSVHSNSPDARQPPKLRFAPQVLGSDRQAESPSSVYSDSLSVKPLKTSRNGLPPTEPQVDVKGVDPYTYIATCPPDRRDEINQGLKRSKSMKDKLNAWKGRSKS